MEKSANKLWRESGSTLSFKDWINRENQKKEESEHTFLSFDGENVSDDTMVSDTINYTISGGDVSQSTPIGRTKTILGLNRGVLIISSILIAGSLGFYFYSKLKKRQ